jgi:hypothetical protein
VSPEPKEQAEARKEEDAQKERAPIHLHQPMVDSQSLDPSVLAPGKTGRQATFFAKNLLRNAERGRGLIASGTVAVKVWRWLDRVQSLKPTRAARRSGRRWLRLREKICSN